MTFAMRNAIPLWILRSSPLITVPMMAEAAKTAVFEETQISRLHRSLCWEIRGGPFLSSEKSLLAFLQNHWTALQSGQFNADGVWDDTSLYDFRMAI